MKFTLFLLLAFLFTLNLISANPWGYESHPPTPAQAKHHHSHPSASPSPRPGHHKRMEKTVLERLISENRPASKMVRSEEGLERKRKVWGSKAKRA